MKGLSPRARDYVRRQATAVMANSSTCRIERVQRAGYDEETLITSPASRTTIYEGICRIWEVAGSGTVVVGENDISMQSTQLSIPWDASPVPHKDDEAVVLTSLDPDMVGRRFRIDGVAKAGELRATRRFNVSLVQEKK